MKKITSLFLGAIFPLTIFAQIKSVDVDSKITQLTVYLNNAEVTSSKIVTLQPGQTELDFTDLSPYINDNSVRVSIEDQTVDILMINTVTNYLLKTQNSPEITNLKDSVKLLNSQIQLYKDELGALAAEKGILSANQSISSNTNGVDFQQLKAIADYNRTRIFEINKRVTQLNSLIYDAQTLVSKYQNQLNELDKDNTYARKVVKVLVETSSSITTNVKITYLVLNCGWSPSYDIKATDTDKPIEFEYRALVYNNTGIDWVNLPFKLSTYDITTDNSIPSLTTWYLSPVNLRQQVFRVTKQNTAPLSDTKSMADDDFSDENNQQMDISQIQQNNIVEYETAIPQLSYEFEITRKYTIPSDGKPYVVNIMQKELPATYQHYAVSKLKPDVLLIARISGWEGLNIVDGPANVFYAGSFVGKSFISTVNVVDTLDISLGKDSKVLVKRSKINKYESSQIIGNKRKIVMSYRYDVKNFHTSPINLQILDQIPISQSDDIEVKTIEVSGGEIDTKTGQITWNMTLNSNDTKTLEFSYSIKYPKNISIPLNENQQEVNVRFFNNY